MAITMENIKARRQKLEQGAGGRQSGAALPVRSGTADKSTARQDHSVGTVPAPLAKTAGSGVSMESIKARRATLEQNTRDKALQQYTERHISDMGEVDARNEPSQALRASSPRVGATGVSGKFPLDARSSTGRKMAGAATEGSGPVQQMPEAAARALDMGQKWGVPAKSGNVLENVGSGAMAYGSGPAQELRASFAKDSVPDEFDRINQWMDTGDNKNLADAVRRVDNTHGAYTDADLIKKGGWTQAQIDEARKMNAALDAIPAWKRDVRRAANAIGGITDTVAAAPVLGAEYGVQAGKNIDATLKNWKQVEQEVKGDEHAQSLFDLLTDVDMDYNPTWPESRNRELISMGYNSKEIREMRQKLAGLEVSDGIDKNQSVGYQLYDRGQRLTAAAQSGLSPTQRAVAGAVTSAAENLAVAGVNPAAVLPVLSAQGAAEAMGQSAEKGESAGKALGGGLAKFGAGWAINSVGAADLAKTMGSDYAKDTLAGQIADWVQGLAGSSELAKRYPAVAAAISGGIDNSMQAFAETYADMAIDAALGDSEAAKNLFSKDTFLTALESGFSGGASGALGGAVGSRLRSMSEALDRATEPSQSAADSSADRALAGQDLSVADATAPLKRGATGVPGSSQLDAGSAAGREMAGLATEGSGSGPAQQTLGAATREQSAFLKGNSTEGMQRAEETAVNDDPAVHTTAQNASIEEYKNSVDPGLAEYVDRVRAGEKLEPYVVAETGDRMRSAMMELTGLEKVGDRTLMDSNAVQHITNRHAGGDGSADGTMKESADVARAAYVLNNFDNAYLSKNKADGYFNSKGKRASIIIFEKKIDGSHVVVEAVCDTKKNTNYIVTEYLSKNGVGKKEVAKGLRSPMSAASDPGVYVRNVVVDPSATAEELQSSMDAASDPRDTPETLADLPSAKTNIAPEGGVVNAPSQSAAPTAPPEGRATGESVGSEQDAGSAAGRERAGVAAQASRSYAEETLTEDESALDSSGWASGEQKAAAAQLARAGRVSTQGVQTIADNMPGGIGAGVYTQAAKALYRMGVNEVGSFAEALKLTGPEGSMGGAVRQVLALGKQGENALKLAYLQGKGEAEVYNAHKAGELGSGKGAVRPDAGTVYRGDKAVSGDKSADEAFLKLTAQSTGTAIHRMMQGLENNAKGCIKAAAGEMFFAGDAGSETVMHETFHALNQWSAETGQAVMDRLLNYLVQQSGAESTEKLIQSYLDKYAEAGQQLTYNQALEEITADAMETVFGTAESFRDFVRQQAAEARMNADARGIIGKVMDKIQGLLESVLADVEHFLKKEPTNAAAKAAKSLTEEQLRDLRALYFEHQMTAGEKYREAIHDAKQGSKNAAPSETKDAAVKYQLEVDADSRDAADSGGLGDVDAQMETIQKAVEAGGNKRVSEEGLRSIAQAVRADHGSRVSAKWLTERLGALSDYLSQGKGVDWADANAFVMDIAEQIMQKSSKRNDELWKAYPELHKMSMQLEKGSAAYDEILYRYGSWANARKEAARHGVNLTYTKDGQASRWDGDFAELQKLGAGLLPAETPSSAADALEAMMSAHDAIKPTLENAYDEDWDGAKQDIAMQIWQRYMNAPELANEQNAGLRKNFAEQWREMREQARQEAADARAKATLALSEKKIKDAQWAGRELAKHTAMEKARRDAQVDKVRTQKEMDNTRRSIRRLTTQLNGMLDSKKNTSSVPESIAKQVLTVARIANDSIRNKEMLGKMRKLGAMISQSAKDTGDRAGAEWLNSGMDDKIEGWLQDVEASREAALERTKKEVQRVNKRLDALAKAAEKTGADYSKEEADLKAYLAHLKMRQVEYEDGGMARMTADQLRGLREILEQTTYIVKNENKLLGEELKADIDEFAKGADKEMREAKGLDFGKGLKGTLSQLTADYRMNSLNIQRQFERFGGYVHGGYMEKMGQMLNEGQYKKTSLIVEGTAIFDDVTGPGNLKKMDRFERELVDIGLRADDGRKWLVTRAQVTALYIQAQNQQGLHHMTHGGLKIPNMEYMVKGDKARAEHDTQTVRIGDLKFNEKGNILNESGDAATELEQMKLLGTQKGNLLTELSKYISADDEMGEYTRKVLDDYKKFLQFTQKNINETSMVLSGRKKAIVENYIPQRVDEDTRAVENEGIRYDNSVGSEGFLQPRKNSSKPIYLDDIFSVVNTSLENVAQYAGMAVPLRNVNKLLSTQIEGRNLNAAIRDVWGRQGADYMEHAIKDMYPQRQKAEVGDRMSARLRGSAAGAVLTFNMNVTFMQAASLPTAAAEAGFGSTGHAAVQFAKNVDPLNKLMSAFGLTENRLKKVEAEIAEHGDPLLQYRLRGTKSGELGTAAEVTVAALWEAAKDYVVKNPSEFDAEAQQKGSAAYWAAANKAFQRIVERTQPNYTTMQRTGFQRSGNQFMKFLMMYSTQRQQNMQIAISAGEDLAAQLRRQSAAPSAENAEAVKKAGVRLARAVSSQITAAVVISSMSTLVKLLLHRRKDLQDKNGDITTKKVLSTIFWGAVESLASNPVGGSELYSGISSVVKGNDYDAVSISGVSAVNDIVANVSTFWKEAAKDATEMDEEEAAKHKEKLKKDFSNILGSLSQLFNIPYSNIKKYADAAEAYMDDWQNGTLFDFSSTPSSATGQYDRLYNAIQSGDREEAAAAMKKLEQMLKEGKVKELKVDSELARRLKQYDADVLAAAEARNAGKTRAEEKARQAVFEKLREGLGVAPATDRAKGKADAARRAQLIDLVNKAVDGKADELLAGSKDGSVYDALLDEVENGRAKDVQAEINRLLTAGKDKGSIKDKITEAVKEEYLAGSDGDREKLEKKLLALEDADGNPLYEEKNFAQWVSAADKKAEKAKDEKNWWEGVK